MTRKSPPHPHWTIKKGKNGGRDTLRVFSKFDNLFSQTWSRLVIKRDFEIYPPLLSSARLTALAEQNQPVEKTSMASIPFPSSIKIIAEFVTAEHLIWYFHFLRCKLFLLFECRASEGSVCKMHNEFMRLSG